MTKRVGIADVARTAGVSITTVSHALSGQGNVSAKTREHVRRVAIELGYAPNRIASALRLRRTGIIGFVSDEIATTPFAGKIVLGAQDAAAKRGMLLMVVNSNRDQEVENQQITSLLDQQVDGFIYARMSHGMVNLPQRLKQIPTVLVDAEDLNGVAPWVVPDEVGIARTATQHLLDAGHRRIAHIAVSEPGPAINSRSLAYRELMEEQGLEPLVVMVDGPADARAGRECFSQVLDRMPDVTAVFAFNDPMAMGVYQGAVARGMRVPDDISVVGVDNLELIAAQLSPGLTTVSLPHYEMGRWAVEELARLIDDPAWSDNPAQVAFACPLIERESVAPPRVS